MINQIFQEFFNKIIIIYLDNILIYLNLIKDYYKYIKDVLRKFIEHCLYAKSLKYMIKKFTLEFYKHVVEKRKI